MSVSDVDREEAPPDDFVLRQRLLGRRRLNAVTAAAALLLVVAGVALPTARERVISLQPTTAPVWFGAFGSVGWLVVILLVTLAGVLLVVRDIPQNGAKGGLAAACLTLGGLATPLLVSRDGVVGSVELGSGYYVLLVGACLCAALYWRRVE